MAAAAARAEYATGMVYGNTAYDTSRVVGGYALPQEETVPTPDELARERQRARENAREHVRRREQVFGVPVLGIVGVLVVAAVLVFVLMGFVELAAISGEMAQTQNAIAELQKQQDALRIKYEMTFNMAEVETYAINILGMTTLAPEEIHRTAPADKAEILNKDETAGILTKLSVVWDSILAYFQ